MAHITPQSAAGPSSATQRVVGGLGLMDGVFFIQEERNQGNEGGEQKTVRSRTWAPLLVWCAVFFVVVSFGALWFGVPRTWSLMRAQAYTPRLPLAELRAGWKHAPLPPSQQAVLATQAGNELDIPALNVHLPLVRAKSMADNDLTDALRYGVVLFPTGSEPGAAGNAIITAHSTAEPWKGPFRFAFMNIDKLHIGDQISVTYGPRTFSYRVTGKRILDPKEEETIPTGGTNAHLTLITCWPLWTADKRLLVEAELADVGPAAGHLANAR